MWVWIVVCLYTSALRWSEELSRLSPAITLRCWDVCADWTDVQENMCEVYTLDLGGRVASTSICWSIISTKISLNSLVLVIVRFSWLSLHHVTKSVTISPYIGYNMNQDTYRNSMVHHWIWSMPHWKTSGCRGIGMNWWSGGQELGPGWSSIAACTPSSISQVTKAMK